MIKRLQEVSGKYIEKIIGQDRFSYAHSDTNDFYDLIEQSKSGGYQGSVILFFDFESGKVFKPFAKKEMSFTVILSMQRVFTIFCRAIMTKRKSLCTAIFPENFQKKRQNLVQKK